MGVGGGETECLVRTVEEKMFVGSDVWTREALTLSSFPPREAGELEVTQYEAENGRMRSRSRSQSHAPHDLLVFLNWLA